MTTSMLSLALDKPIRNDLDMTGRLLYVSLIQCEVCPMSQRYSILIYPTYR